MFSKFLIDKMDKNMQYHQLQQHLHNHKHLKTTQQATQQQQQQQQQKPKMPVMDTTVMSTMSHNSQFKHEPQPPPASQHCTTITTTKTMKHISVKTTTVTTQTTQNSAKIKLQLVEQPLDLTVQPQRTTKSSKTMSTTTTTGRCSHTADGGANRGADRCQLPNAIRSANCTTAAMGITPPPPRSISMNMNAHELVRSPRRGNMRDLCVIQNRTMQVQDKNIEALRELHENIPEISKIFDMHCRIGSGTFSTVLLGTLQRERPLAESQRRRFAIKHHNPTNHPERILRELECMFMIGGVENVIGINCCIRYNDNVAFVMPYMSHDRFHDIYRSLSLVEISEYIRKLLVALRHVHKFNIIHRDVKPSNILFNRRTRQFLLCDFGLAQQVAADGSITQSSEHNSIALMRTMETARQQMLAGGGADGTTCQDEADAYRMVANNDETMKHVRAVGGGGGAGHMLATTRFIPPAFDSRRKNCANMLTKKDIANQKADTMRLVNRLRFFNSNIDPNHYVVSTNTTHKEVHASRAGTPGYRPPEVLMRYPLQTTAVDIWAAGVILLSLLSSMHPFFKAPNDCCALSEIINLFGDLSVRKTAFLMDRLVLLTQKANAMDLRRVCMRFRYADHFLSPEIMRRYQRADGTFEMCHNCVQPFFNCLCKHSNYRLEQYDGVDIFPSTVYDLLTRLLEVNPHKRITAEEALKHPFFSDHQRIIAGVPTHQLTAASQQSTALLQQQKEQSHSLKPYIVGSSCCKE